MDIEIMPLELDVRAAAAVKAGLGQARQKFGRIDIAVNNAGISGSGKPTHEVEEAEWLNVTDVLLNGVWRCQREELAVMTEQAVVSPREGRGCIINVASMLGLVGHNTAVAYTAAKHGKQHTCTPEVLKLIIAKNQTRRCRAHAGRRPTIRAPRHPDQRRRARLHRDAPGPGPDAAQPRGGGDLDGGHRKGAAGPPCHGGGNCRLHRVPRLAHEQLRAWVRLGGGRGVYRCLSDEAI